MSELSFYNQARSIWKTLSNGDSGQVAGTSFQLPPGALDSIFQVGNSYYFVFDLAAGLFSYIHPNVKDVLGYDPGELQVDRFLSYIHPEDMSFFLDFEDEVRFFFKRLQLCDFLHYKVSYDYRIRTADNTFIRLLQQMVAINYNDDGYVLQTVGVHTDITHLKEGGKPKLSFIGLNGRPSFYDVGAHREASFPIHTLTRREREVLRLVCAGYSTREIADTLFLSPHTVSTHRKNILQKVDVRSVAELVSTAVQRGWV